MLETGQHKGGGQQPQSGGARRGRSGPPCESQHDDKRAEDCREGRIFVNDLMRDYLAVPGLGLVKAGFVVQLLVGEAGCMDMHNLARLGLDPDEFDIPKRADPEEQLLVINECIAHYLYMCEKFGGSEHLWNGWCEFVAETYRTYDDAEDVSRRHVTYLSGGA